MNGAKNKFKPLIFLFFISFITNCKCSTKVDLSKNNDLSIETRKFSYSSTITFGLSANLTRGIFTSPQESAMEEYGLDEGNEKYSFLFTGIGFSFNYNILFSSYFFANRLGFFPRFGIGFNIISQNYLTRFLAYLPQNIGCFFRNALIRTGNFFGEHAYKLFCMSNPRRIEAELSVYRKNFLKNPSGIGNIIITFEPETGVFEKFKIVPQIGIGPAIVFLTKNCKAPWFPSDRNERGNNDVYMYKQMFDISFTCKFILKYAFTENCLNVFQLEIGYMYNPLILSLLDVDTEKWIINGGIWNIFLSLNYSRNINVGLESVEFFNEQIETSIKTSNSKKNNKSKTTMFFECGIGLGKWVNISSSSKISDSIFPNINFSFSLPYFGVKLSDHHYLSFIGVDVSEDMFTGKYSNKDHNILWKIVNNLTVNYNFLNLVSDYDGVIFMHKLGIYVPFLTNIMSSADNLSKSHFFQREMISVENKESYSILDNSIKYLFFGRFTYRFKMYLDITKLFNIRCKYSIYMNFGLNTTLLNRRNDCYTSNQAIGRLSTEIIKIESVNLGVSFVIN